MLDKETIKLALLQASEAHVRLAMANNNLMISSLSPPIHNNAELEVEILNISIMINRLIQTVDSLNLQEIQKWQDGNT